MERAIRCDNSIAVADVAAAVQPRELEGRFVRVRTAVPEAATATEVVPRDRLREQGLRLRVQKVPHVPQLGGLLRRRIDEFRMTMSQNRCTESGEQIQVALPRGVRELAAMPLADGDSIARVIEHEVAI